MTIAVDDEVEDLCQRQSRPGAVRAASERS
jgi:hypothetical protein